MDRRKKGWLTLTALTLLLIWGNSLLSGTVSGSISEWVKNLLNIPLRDVTGSGMADDEVLRKIAHATEFALLGAELTVVLRVLWNKAGSLLALCGMIDYAGGRPTAVSFAIEGPHGMAGFTLPAAVDGTLRVFAKQKVKADRQQAERTAWRNVRDWVLAQMALVESCDVPMDQVFLPYLADKQGRTLYDAYASGQLMLEAPQA